jgi:segregation and condensation protein A
MMVEDDDSRLAISLPRYEGPFDLLLAMIRRYQYPIDHLPVVEITARFLAYVRAARDLDAELAGEFVEVASWLVLLKSRSLLPRGSEKGPEPHEELRRAVLDHQTLRAATEALGVRTGRSRVGAAGARSGRGDQSADDEPPELPTVADVLEAARRAIEAARAARSLEGAGAGVATVEEMMEWIRMKLAATAPGQSVSSQRWFSEHPRSGAALLLALLEMAAKGVLALYQERDFGPIAVQAAGTTGDDCRGVERVNPLPAPDEAAGTLAR